MTVLLILWTIFAVWCVPPPLLLLSRTSSTKFSLCRLHILSFSVLSPPVPSQWLLKDVCHIIINFCNPTSVHCLFRYYHLSYFSAIFFFFNLEIEVNLTSLKKKKSSFPRSANLLVAWFFQNYFLFISMNISKLAALIVGSDMLFK